MSSGIYALYWWEQDLVYVGLSQCVHRRRAEHFRLMKLGLHSNYRVQESYDRYGYPDFIILEKCSIENLPAEEVRWVNEFEALGSRGLCIVEPGIVGFGPASNSAKYTKLQILVVFRLLYTTSISYPEIEAITKVSASTVSDIARGKSHLWLAEAYKFQYKRIKPRISGANMLRTVTSYLVSPNGNILECVNIRAFAKEHNLHNTCLGDVIRGSRKSHKGWKLAELT